MKWHHPSRFQIGFRMWVARLAATAVLVILSGGNHEANAIMMSPVDGVDGLLITVQSTSFFLPDFSLDVVQGLPLSTSADLGSRSPITTVAPAPSSGLLFMTALFGMLGVAVLRRTVVQKASHPQADPHRPRSAGSVIVLSHDKALAGGIEERLRRAGYDIHVATAVSELFTLSDPATLALVLVDQRIQDWDVLRTDPLFRHVQLMTVVPPNSTYTEEHCLSDLERGIDGVHDLQDGHGLLVAKVGAYLRRMGASRIPRGVYRVGAVSLDSDSHEVTIAGRPVHLSAKPLAILEALMRTPFKVFTRSELTNLVWGQNFAVGGHALDVHVHALRRQLDRHPDRLCRIITVKGIGFKLKPVTSIDRIEQGEFVRAQRQDPIRPHNQRRLRYVHRHRQQNRPTDPERRVMTADGEAPLIYRHAKVAGTGR